MSFVSSRLFFGLFPKFPLSVICLWIHCFNKKSRYQSQHQSRRSGSDLLVLPEDALF